MSKWLALIPEEYFDRERKHDFLMWLLFLPCDIYTKKYILLAWAKVVGVTVTEEDVRFITGGRESATRG